MDQDIEISLREAARAIERLNEAFERRAEALRAQGDAQELASWIKATYAMRDSGQIYLSWAKHYARAAGVETQLLESETDELLEE